MQSYDWLVIGGGITGAALSYELQNAGFSVVLIEKDNQLQGASKLGYGGIPFWSGTDLVTCQLFSEGLIKHQHLCSELGFDTQFRNLDLLLTIDLDPVSELNDDMEFQRSSFAKFEFPPTLISVPQSLELEPLLNGEAIAGCWHFNHAHVNPLALCQAYNHAFHRLGGISIYENVLEVANQSVKTDQNLYSCAQIAICAGGMSRHLLSQSGILANLYFTHCEVLETAPVDLELRTMVMPAKNDRLGLEARISQPEYEQFWQNQQPFPQNQLEHDSNFLAIDVGAIQFSDRTIKIGQPSYLHTDPLFKGKPEQNQTDLRDRIAKILPQLANLPASYSHCLVAFSGDSLPLIGELPEFPNIHLFTSFTSPMIYVPPLAQRFAKAATGASDPILTRFNPQRIAESDSL
jgi:glycine/D-amino acid oxidase-like deaminating enzyme